MQADAPPIVSTVMRLVLRLVALEGATSRAEIARRGGLARSTVGQQVDTLLARGILQEVVQESSVRGRPPHQLSVDPRAGIVAVADIGPRSTELAITNLVGHLIERLSLPIDIDDGPNRVLARVSDELAALLSLHGYDGRSVRQLVVGLPGPVDYVKRWAVRPPIMPGWDGYPVGKELAVRFSCRVIVDNDANLMALGEAARSETVETPLLGVKIGEGIGAGLVVIGGDVLRGADGAAGDIGHIRVVTADGTLCSCGKQGCLEAVASSTAVLRDLGVPMDTPEQRAAAATELRERLERGDASALARVRQAGESIGEALGMLVQAYNPRTLVLSGPMVEASDDLLSEVRAVVYRRALPLATRKLVITASQLGERAGLIGGVVLGVREVFTDEGIDELLTTGLDEKQAPTASFPPVLRNPIASSASSGPQLSTWGL